MKSLTGLRLPIGSDRCTIVEHGISSCAMTANELISQSSCGILGNKSEEGVWVDGREDTIDHLSQDTPFFFLLIRYSLSASVWVNPCAVTLVLFFMTENVLLTTACRRVFILVLSVRPFPFILWHIQWMEAGLRGQTGLPVTYAVVAVCRNVLALAQIRLLSMGEPSVRACRYRRAPATRCVQVSA